MTVVHDGIDTSVFRPVISRKQKRKPGKTGVAIGITGRVEHRRKGQDLFIEAARIASQKRNDLRFLIVGDEREGMEKEELKLHSMVKDYGLEKIVEFRGSVVPEKMPPLMNEIDIHVVCSKQPEGLSIVLLEAMACGKAVISFAEGGPLDILVNGVNGLLVSPRDTQKLAEAIVALANDSKLRSTLGAEARRTVVGRFRAEKTAGRVEEIYRKIVRECRL